MRLRQLLVIASLPSIAACDVVWGLSGEPNACELRSFEGLEPVSMLSGGNHFSVTGNATLAVVESDGLLFERSLRDDAAPQRLELGPYSPISVAMAPEGTLMFHSGALEPPLLQAAIRVDGLWLPADRPPPKGVIAGVPSALEFGARRVIVRTKDNLPDVQEYEDTGTEWKAVGERQQLPGGQAINLTENGLTIAFVDLDPVTLVPAVFAASRDSRAEWFGEPQLLRTAAGASSAQLIGKTTCDTMFVSGFDSLQRFE